MTTPPNYRPATQRDVEVIAPAPMTNWFAPMQLIQIGIKALLGTLFGSYLDRRELQAALLRGNLQEEAGRLDYSNRDELWIDYVADLGDGWDSTYTVAYLLGQKELQLGDAKTVRGQVLVMGGDEVYPTATVEDYQAKLKDPYRSALPWLDENERPKLFAVAGNHDWYDGLGSFLKVFCQERSIGAWKTQQSRSYFALKLPHRWWLWGIDIQLETDIDKPQIDYFDHFAQQLQPGDRVILCTPTSSWVEAGDDDVNARREERSNQNLSFLEDRIRKHGAEITISLAGNLHHYSHYVRSEGERHKFTAGGGGAYLCGTHELPERLRLYEGGQTRDEYRRVAAYPDAPASRRLRLGALGFFYRNLAFSAFLGASYLFYGWLLQSASKVPNPHLENTTLMEVLANVPIGIGTFFCTVMSKFYWVLAHSPGVTLVTLFTIMAWWAFCDREPGVKATLKRLLFGGGHGVLHIFLAVVLFWVIARFNLGPVQQWSGMDMTQWLDHPLQALLFGVEMLAGGIVLGGTLMGAYLVVANALAGFQAETVFSAQAIPHYKNFLRLHLTRDKLTVYPIGIEKVHRHWKLGPAVQPAQSPPGVTGKAWTFTIDKEDTRPWIEPNDDDGKPFLIERPVEIGKRQ
ncbi:MAG: hypothetical protein AABM64_06745 [Pseudomonadota bacterium]